MTLKPVTFKLPEDEVADIDSEADNKNKSRSEHLRDIVRARHVDIKEQLEEQVLTEDDKEEYEERIEELKKERDGYHQSMRLKEGQIETMESTIDRTVEEAIESVRDEYEAQIEELQAENEQLRTSVRELSEGVATKSDVEDAEQKLEERLEEKLNLHWDAFIDQRELVDSLIYACTDDIIDEIQETRSPATKLADWLWSLPSRIKSSIHREASADQQ